MFLLLPIFLPSVLSIRPFLNGLFDSESIKTDYDLNIGRTYKRDPRQNVIGYNSQAVIDKNTFWYDWVRNDTTRAKFVDDMINIDGAVTITPDLLDGHIDKSPYCWIIYTYDTRVKDYYEEILELGTAVAKYFEDRCGVGAMDISYPSNGDLFPKGYSAYPTILARYGHQSHTMFDESKLFRKENPTFELNDVKNWGIKISYTSLARQPADSFKEAEKVYDKMSEGHKISLYLTSSIITKQSNTVEEEDGLIRNQGWKVLEGREAYLPIFEKLYTQLNEDASKDAEKKFGPPENFEQFQAQHAWYMNQLNQKLSKMDFKTELEKRFQEMLETSDMPQEEKDQIPELEKDPAAACLPSDPPKVTSMLSKWISRHNEL